MKKRICSIMDTGKKKTGIAVICVALLLTVGTGVGFAVNAVTKMPQPTESNGVLMGRNSDAGDDQFTQEEYALVLAQKFDGYESMTLEDFNSRIAAYGEAHGEEYLNAMEHVIGGISGNDPNAIFLLNTLTASGQENACKHWQSFDTNRNPEIYGIATKGINGQVIDGTLYYDWQISVDYSINYIVNDEKMITVSERDQFVQGFLQGMQEFVNEKSQDDWTNMTSDEMQTVVTKELNRLSVAYSNNNIKAVSVKFLGVS